ncbi:LacI family DNA-binding transcriptional regulator [Bifidobacterium sp. ESL0775]|uniref:LacI family DNA-binding transcriptional regulator n=1 Tax=Bifidobacterium sp. ESL0775 TaxID=2983230 RepID=UPI0023F7BCFE|nr:LacI family DNA-binding transcriptional regulator [Bifidobacterium sp. ESL0775]WEV69503.1 LacI family DNA-binding transcriptional regulator [Bifidobacterium sp. ESL0775]
MATDIREVARAAGVSISTVSRTFTKPELVAPRTRTKVTQAAEKLGFHISRSAAALKSGQTMRIALLTSDGVSTWFDAHAFAGLDSVFHPAGYDISVFRMTTTAERREFFMDLPVRRNVDAVIVDSFDIDPEEVSRLKTMHVPIVGINVPSPVGFDATVGIDDKGAMHTAVDHLAALGHRDIGYIGEYSHRQLHYSAESRLQGFRDACAQHGDVRPQVLLFDAGPQFCDQAINAILTSRPRLTAVCFIKDETALPILYRLHRYGREVPRDLSAIGFDDIELASAIGLTTLHQDPFEIGAEAARKTLSAMDNKAEDTTASLADAGQSEDRASGTATAKQDQGEDSHQEPPADEAVKAAEAASGWPSPESSDGNPYQVFPVQLMLRDTTAPLAAADAAEASPDELRRERTSSVAPVSPKASSFAYVPTPAYRGRA